MLETSKLTFIAAFTSVCNTLCERMSHAVCRQVHAQRQHLGHRHLLGLVQVVPLPRGGVLIVKHRLLRGWLGRVPLTDCAGLLVYHHIAGLFAAQVRLRSLAPRRAVTGKGFVREKVIV